MDMIRSSLEKKWYVNGPDNTEVFDFGYLAIRYINTCLASYYFESGTNEDLVLLRQIRAEVEQFAHDILNLKTFKEQENILAIGELWESYKTLYAKYLLGDWDSRTAKEKANGDRLLRYYADKNFNVKYSTDIINHNSIPCQKYLLVDNRELYHLAMFYLDLWELLLNPSVTMGIKRCERCGLLYFTNSRTSKYCPECRPITDDTAIRTPVEYECREYHNEILKLLDKYNLKQDAARDSGIQNSNISRAFITTSNYYWNVIHGQLPAINKFSLFRDIRNSHEYLTWLKQIHENIKNNII